MNNVVKLITSSVDEVTGLRYTREQNLEAEKLRRIEEQTRETARELVNQYLSGLLYFDEMLNALVKLRSQVK